MLRSANPPPLRDRSRWRHRGRAFRAVLQLAVLHLLVESAEQTALDLARWGRSRSFVKGGGPRAQERMPAFSDRMRCSSPDAAHSAGDLPACAAAQSPSGTILVLRVRGGRWDGDLSPVPEDDDMLQDAEAENMMAGMRFAKSDGQPEWCGVENGQAMVTLNRDEDWLKAHCAIEGCDKPAKYGVLSPSD